MNKLKKIYDRITLREKMLLVLFLWVVVFIWFGFYWSRISQRFEDIGKVKASLAYQKVWLNNEDSIAKRLEESRQILNPQKTYARSRFIGRVDGLARETGASYDVTNPTTQSGEIFNEHSLVVQFKDASLKNLINFANAIHNENPYLGVKQVKITPNRRDPNLLNAQFDVIALELKNIENVQNKK